MEDHSVVHLKGLIAKKDKIEEEIKAFQEVLESVCCLVCSRLFHDIFLNLGHLDLFQKLHCRFLRNLDKKK